MLYIVYRVFAITFRAPVPETPMILIYGISFLIETVNFCSAYTDFTAIQGMLYICKSIKPSYRLFTVHFFFVLFYDSDGFGLQMFWSVDGNTDTSCL